jgi:hypothetical protein
LRMSARRSRLPIAMGEMPPQDRQSTSDARTAAAPQTEDCLRSPRCPGQDRWRRRRRRRVKGEGIHLNFSIISKDKH